MSQPIHTPEPWAYDEDDSRIYYDDGDVQPTIAYMEREGVAPEQVKADGYVLAAARQMLAALEDLIAWEAPAGIAVKSRWGVALAAIAKAKGASS